MALLGRAFHARLAGWLLLCLLGSLPSLARAQEVAGEVQVKAAFLFKFTQFTSWPEDSLGDPASPLEICVLEDDELAEVLQGAVQGRSSNGHPVVVRRVDRRSAITGCHALYLGCSVPNRPAALLAGLAEHPVLTITDHPGFAKQGSMINFLHRRDRLAFEINRGNVERAGLRLSSQLLKLAIIVDEP